MARSGSYSFSINRDEIINGAFRQIGVLGESQTASSTRISQASDQLNLLIDEWEMSGIGLWLAKECVLFPQADQTKYYFGPTGISSYGICPDFRRIAIDKELRQMGNCARKSGTLAQ